MRTAKKTTKRSINKLKGWSAFKKPIIFSSFFSFFQYREQFPPILFFLFFLLKIFKKPTKKQTNKQITNKEDQTIHIHTCLSSTR